jgi:hypothetical protein
LFPWAQNKSNNPSTFAAVYFHPGDELLAPLAERQPRPKFRDRHSDHRRDGRQCYPRPHWPREHLRDSPQPSG